MISADLFVAPDVVQEEIELADGKTYTFHFKPLAAADYGVTLAAYLGDSIEFKSAAITRAVSKAVCDAEGAAVMSAADASRLKPEVLNRLWGIVWRLNYEVLATETDTAKQ